MKQRGSPAVAVTAESRNAHPLALLPPSLPPTFIVRIVREAAMPPDWKRRTLPPGTYRVTANVVIEADLTEDQLRNLFRRDAPGAAAVQVEPEVDPAEEAWRLQLQARARELTAAYESQARDAPRTMSEAMGTWLQEFGETEIREAIAETAKARISSRDARYAFFKNQLRERRFQKMRERT